MDKNVGLVRNKGMSLMTFPESYTVIDIETTGLDPKYDSIIEVSAIKYINNIKTSEFSSLIKPDSYYTLDSDYVFDGGDYVVDNGHNIRYVDGFITQLTGITNEMLSTAPGPQTVLSELYTFLEQDILVGHNVNFDINFLYDNFNYYLDKRLQNNFIDTMRISRRLLPALKHHRLKDIAAHYSICDIGSHRALRDCEITNACFLELNKTLINTYGDLQAFNESLKKASIVKATNISTSKTDFDLSHPLYGKVCVFTGTLERMIRKDAMQIVADFGGVNGDSITAKTNYLILGNNDYCKLIKDGKSNKQKKAEKLKLDGQDIEILTENVFYDLIY
jgi:DNA polymerase III subunit epsilon